MLVEMKGLKGEGGPVGNQGFIGARGVKLKSKFISSFCLSSSALSLWHILLFSKGSKGFPGVPGEEGTHGFPGDPSNEKGYQGDPGPQGLPGIKGMPGITGNRGITGFGGMHGVKVKLSIK